MLQAADLTIRLNPADDVVIAREKTKSEMFGYGEDEFAPWVLGATM